jgi:hypothetical protein
MILACLLLAAWASPGQIQAHAHLLSAQQHADLAAAVRKQQSSHKTPAIILTACDAECLKKLLQLWLTAMSASGDSQHAVVVAMGVQAHALCTSQQAGKAGGKQKHMCA